MAQFESQSGEIEPPSVLFYSPDSEYACCGSADGSVYIWDVNKNKVEQTLKEHR